MEQVGLQNRWLETAANAWTVALARELCDGIENESWKVDAVLASRTSSVDVQLVLLEKALAASDRLLVRLSCLLEDSTRSSEALKQLVESDTDALQSIRQRRELLVLQDKARTWQEIFGSSSTSTSKSALQAEPPSNDEDVEISWQFDEEENNNDIAVSSNDSDRVASEDSAFSPSLPEFLDTSVLDSATRLAAEGQFFGLARLFVRHAESLSPRILFVLDHIPPFANVSDYINLLPKLDIGQGSEYAIPGKPWRMIPDWSEHPTITAFADVHSDLLPPASAEEIAMWYQKRVDSLDTFTGQVDSALELLQYGASHGVSGLDARGEELSLLSKLVYDRGATVGNEEVLLVADDLQAWNLRRWQSSSADQIIKAYLGQSTVATIPSDIRRLVLPYLYVLESQLEREGHADASLHDRLLFDWVLDIASSRLDIVAAVFEASKPNTSHGQRLIKSDEQLAKLAISCVYAHTGVSSWSAMSTIFECLPAFEDGDLSSESQQNLVNIVSTSSSTSSLTAKLIYASLQMFSISAVSRALDSFDLHLEAAEVFSRWSSPMPLRFFAILASDENLQRSWAHRLAKTSPAAVNSNQNSGSAKLGQDFEYEDEWLSLLDDLCRLAGKDIYKDNEAKPAFANLTTKEVTKIFLGGLLSSGSECKYGKKDFRRDSSN